MHDSKERLLFWCYVFVLVITISLDVILLFGVTFSPLTSFDFFILVCLGLINVINLWGLEYIYDYTKTGEWGNGK